MLAVPSTEQRPSTSLLISYRFQWLLLLSLGQTRSYRPETTGMSNSSRTTLSLLGERKRLLTHPPETITTTGAMRNGKKPLEHVITARGRRPVAQGHCLA